MSESLIAGLNLANDMEVKWLKICSDSQVITLQVQGNYQAKDQLLMRYLQKVQFLLQKLNYYEVKYISHEENV